MKLTNKQLVEAYPFLNALGAVNLPPRVGFGISRLIRKVRDIAQDFETERSKIVNACGEKDEEGKLKTFETNGQDSTRIEDKETYAKDMGDLLSYENEIEVSTVSVKDLGDIPMAPNMFAALDWLIVE